MNRRSLRLACIVVCFFVLPTAFAQVDIYPPKSGLHPAVSLTGGFWHTCAVLNDGNVTCWGSDSHGQSTAYTGGDAVTVHASGNFTCAVLSTGNVRCWGDNAYGQTAGYDDGDAVSVATGVGHACALASSGNVFCWGDDREGQTDGYSGGDAVAIAANGYYTCALLANATVACWGYNGYNHASPDTSGDVVAIGAGNSHRCLLRTNGNIACVGGSWVGPAATGGHADGDAIGVGAGVNHSCALRASGDVRCWGYYETASGRAYGASYIGGDATAVASGGQHTCVLRATGDVECWGNNTYGQAAGYHPLLPNLTARSVTVEQEVGPTPITTITVPALGSPEIPPQDVTTPYVPEKTLFTPLIPIPLVCLPGEVLCAGPFEIYPQAIITLPGLDERSVTTPGISGVPLTPEVSYTPSLPRVAFGISTTGLEPLVTTNFGETETYGPHETYVPTPFGPFPVVICASTCQIPVAPDVNLERTVTVTLTVGDITVSETVPLSF